MTKEKPMVGAVEIVIYQANEGVSEAQAILLAKSVNNFISSQQGFISRTMSMSEDKKWIDVVFWESLHHAKKASGKAMESEQTAGFFQIINHETMQIVHGEIVFEMNNPINHGV